MFNTQVVYNVSQPTITAYLPPKDLATGTAVIVTTGNNLDDYHRSLNPR